MVEATERHHGMLHDPPGSIDEAEKPVPASRTSPSWFDKRWRAKRIGRMRAVLDRRERVVVDETSERDPAGAVKDVVMIPWARQGDAMSMYPMPRLCALLRRFP